MAKITHVRKAQQRYKTVPVLDESGEPVRTPVMRSTGVQKVTKKGVAVFMTKTVADKTQPLPDLKCDFPGCTINDGKIAVGSAYKHITPKSGPYGGTQKNRHAEHPNWNVWEYSSSLSARVAQTQHEADEMIQGYEFSSYEDFDDLQQQVAEMASGLRDEKEEAVSNMPEGLAEGSQAQEQLDALESWVDEIEGASAPDEPEPEQVVRYYVVGPEAQSLAEEGFEEMEDAQAAFDAHAEENPDEDMDQWSIEEVEEEDPDTEDGVVDEEWADEARSILSEAVSAFEG